MTSSILNEMPLTNRDGRRQISASWRNRSCAALMGATALMSISLSGPATARAQPSQQRPNIVVIMGDDVILGQTPFRTGLLKVGMPPAKQGLQDKDPTIAELLKPYGYATAQIGKNHLGDRNEYLPTVHGFDEFYGILYHLNAMEEPYDPDYPKTPQFLANFGPRNIVDTKAAAVDDPTTDPRWGKVGKQTIIDAGPLPPHPNMDPRAKSNMEDVDDELVRRSVDFIDRSAKANRPFFLWHNSQEAGRPRHCRQHNRGLYQRQWRRDLFLAGWWQFPIPRREGHNF